MPTPQQPNAFNPNPTVANADSPKTLGLYDLENPEFALQNAMIGKGYNPFAANPFTQRLLRSAKGLGYAFLQNAANQNLNPANAAQSGSMFRDFLGSALDQGITGVLAGAYSGLPGAIGQARDFSNQLTGAQNAGSGDSFLASANPFLAQLAQTLAAGGGAGSTGAMMALLGPLMSRSGGNALNTLLTASLGGAARQLPDSGLTGIGSSDDIFRYLWGI